VPFPEVPFPEVPFPEPTAPAGSRAEVFLRYLDYFRSHDLGEVGQPGDRWAGADPATWNGSCSTCSRSTPGTWATWTSSSSSPPAGQENYSLPNGPWRVPPRTPEN